MEIRLDNTSLFLLDRNFEYQNIQKMPFFLQILVH